MSASPEQREKELKELITAWLAQGKRREMDEQINAAQEPREYGSTAQGGPSGFGLGLGK